MSSVKVRKRPKQGPTGERLALLLDAFSPWEGISLTYRQFAAELGAPVTEAAIKKWPQRGKFPADVARLIAHKARERGLSGVTLEWVLWGEGDGLPKARQPSGHGPGTEQPPAVGGGARPERESSGSSTAARIGEALEADLSHNEFGQWSSAEVQHTVIWALKDLARRLRVLRFDMGKTFELTDKWAGVIGLPIRPPDGSPVEHRS